MGTLGTVPYRSDNITSHYGAYFELRRETRRGENHAVASCHVIVTAERL